MRVPSVLVVLLASSAFAVAQRWGPRLPHVPRPSIPLPGNGPRVTPPVTRPPANGPRDTPPVTRPAGNGPRSPTPVPVFLPGGEGTTAGLVVLAVLGAIGGGAWLFSYFANKGDVPAEPWAGSTPAPVGPIRVDPPRRSHSPHLVVRPATATSGESVKGDDEVASLSAATERRMRLRASAYPGWSPEAARVWLEDVFLRMQSAWEARDYGPVREELGDDLYHRHEGLLREMRERGEVNGFEGLEVEGIEFVELTGEEGVVALVTYSGRFYYADSRGNRLGGDTGPARYQEAWFLRRRDGRWTVQGYVPADEYRMPAPPTADGVVMA